MNLKLSLPEDDDDIDITPMIDCVFLLVLFFMVTSSFIDEPARSLGFTVTLPRKEDSPKRPGEQAETVQLTLAGDFFVREGGSDDKIENLDELLETLKKRGSTRTGHPIRFRCDALIEEGQELKAEEARALTVTLPRADKADTIPRNQADSVTVTVEGLYFFQEGAGARESIKDLEALQKRVDKRNAGGKPRPVILRCDARCQYQQFIQTKNALRLAGVETIFEEVEVRHGAAKP